MTFSTAGPLFETFDLNTHLFLKSGDAGSVSSLPTFALVVNGHSLVHALTPELEKLFLGVAEHCTGK
jgi:hypothetical protein